MGEAAYVNFISIIRGQRKGFAIDMDDFLTNRA
jgi:hypothetical protein